jgi:hypothetical protein
LFVCLGGWYLPLVFAICSGGQLGISNSNSLHGRKGQGRILNRLWHAQRSIPVVEQLIHLHHLLDIGNQMTCCLILHNICQADNVMGNKYWQVVYDLAHSTIIAMPGDMHQYHANVDVDPDMIRINHSNASVIEKLLT